MSQQFGFGVEIIVGLVSLCERQECVYSRSGQWPVHFILLKCFLSLRLKVARLDNIFLTRMHWCNVGGLCGEYTLVDQRLVEASGILMYLILAFS